MKDPSPQIAVSQTPMVMESARLPRLLDLYRVNWGLVLALLAALCIWWLLYRTTIGFEIRTVGANPDAARYAGMRVDRTFVMAMALAGVLAGLAGTEEVVGLNYYHTSGFSVGYGFDAIAVALLGKVHPLGVIPSALLFGSLRAGAARMQFRSQIPVDIIQVIQALVLVFVAGERIVRWLYRLPNPKESAAVRPSSLEGPRSS